MSFLWLLEGIRTPFLDKLMQFITYFGQEVIIIAFVCALYWCIDKRFAYLLGFTYFTAGLCVQTLKVTFRIPRPWVLDPDFHAVESAVPGATGYSFPSGHTQGATCLFYPLAKKSQKLLLKILCVLAFLLIGFSRMYLGCHTPKDVLVSMGLSLLIATFIWRFQSAFLDDNRYLKPIAIILFLTSIAVALYALWLMKGGTISAKYASDCCKAAGAGLGFSVGWYLERTHFHFDPQIGSAFAKVIRLLLGLFFTVLLKEGLGMLAKSSILAKMAEYFILVLWILIIYPWIYHKLARRTL